MRLSRGQNPSRTEDSTLKGLCARAVTRHRADFPRAEVRTWSDPLDSHEIEYDFVEGKGKKGRVESFHARLREECLNVSWFQNLFDASRKIAAWKTEYNEESPHSSLGYRTPRVCGSARSRFLHS
jgi:hypothetical protein